MCAALFFAGCAGRSGGGDSASAAVDPSVVVSPNFCADTAYRFVADQVAFGPRTPGSVAHRRCAVYIVRQMWRWCDTVVVQPFSATLWNGTVVQGKNIIATVKGNKNAGDRRIMLAAHWDSRFWADHDPDEANRKSPIVGANDGASGAGVLMELARVLSAMPPAVSVDFVFFDVEDQGVPEWADAYKDDSWCLGSQYWSLHPHVPYYTAVYGILLDMVGTQQPRYSKEEVSRTYASGITNKVWNMAEAMGHGSVFVQTETDPILDDHYYVNRLAGIPMLDIVQNGASGSFFEQWHTLGDNMEHVSSASLGLCGEVLLKTIYADYPALGEKEAK